MDNDAMLDSIPGAADRGDGPGDATPETAAPRPSTPAFLGQAMSALLRSADVQIERGDQTRVLSRANEVLAEVERRNPGSINEPSAEHSQRPVSGPPRPRVDIMLWVVLTAGLFSIVGWMLAYGL